MTNDSVFWLLIVVSTINAAIVIRRGAGQRGWLAVSCGMLTLLLAGRLGPGGVS